MQISEGKAATEDLKKRMDENDRTFEDRVASIIRCTVGGGSDVGEVPVFSSSSQSNTVRSYAACVTAGSGGSQVAAVRDIKEEEYWRCRRSLRIWPVVGSDLKTALGDFLRTRLMIRPSADMGDISVKKIYAAPSAKIQGEVLALFETPEVRGFGEEGGQGTGRGQRGRNLP